VRWLLALLLVAGCGRQTAVVGALTCGTSSDCAPPDSICGADGYCEAGCAIDTDLCTGASTCDPSTGECSGGTPCSDDSMCDPPAVICSMTTRNCVSGCTLDPCASGLVCNPTSGRCCDPSQPTCPRPPDGGPNCNTDSECVGAPANICSGGACVPGCSQTGCPSTQSCNPSSGHCETLSCARDMDCDPGSYCTAAATCAVLAFAGPIACAGGTTVSFSCAQKSTASQFSACVGPAGSSGCPYCIDRSCFHPGLCSTATDCHRGDACVGAQGGLCTVQPDECPASAIVPIADVCAGKYAAGKELCVRDTVTSLRSGYDGMNEIKLGSGSSSCLFVDVAPMYQSAGVRIPNLNETVTIHGTVRWDEGHNDREILPVDWVSP